MSTTKPPRGTGSKVTNKATSPAAATSAARVLADEGSTHDAKVAAGSALAQVEPTDPVPLELQLAASRAEADQLACDVVRLTVERDAARHEHDELRAASRALVDDATLSLRAINERLTAEVARLTAQVDEQIAWNRQRTGIRT
jgi:hypothetical protein